MTEQNDPSKAGLSTSRRNFVAGISLVGTALAFSVLRPTKAMANHPKGDHGVSCNNPGGSTPGHCICFLRGTKLSTPRGSVAIEKLRIGDCVTTAAGLERPVKWIAHMRRFRPSSRVWDINVRPVRITAGALDGETPLSDLYVSPAHLIYLEGVLIPAGDLVNGTSIVHECADDRLVLDYFHVELEDHEIILAEGAAVESLQATALSRAQFDNFDEYVGLYGTDAPDLTSCAPMMGYCGGRSELASRWRSVIAPIYDARWPSDVARDRIDNLAARGL